LAAISVGVDVDVDADVDADVDVSKRADPLGVGVEERRVRRRSWGTGRSVWTAPCC
jgi:hypothetical protein